MSLNIVPNSGQTLGNTRDAIRINFSNIDTGFAVNHAPFNSGVDTGKHTIVDFIPGAAATPAFSHIAIYNKVSGGLSNLYVRKNNGVLSTEIPFTQSGSNLGALGGKGYTYLPSGVIMKWGTFTTAGGVRVVNAQTIDFPGLPVFTNVFSAQVTSNINATVWVSNITVPAATLTVTVNSNVAVTSFMIFIMGN